MKPDFDRIDEAVLALLFLTSFVEGKGDLAYRRAWKGHDWEAMDRLYEKGFISDPKNKNKSITFSEEGARRAEALFERLFCIPGEEKLKQKVTK